MSELRYGDLALYRRLLVQARPHWPKIFAILLLSVLSAPLALLTPLPLKIAVDSIIGSHSLPPLLGSLWSGVTAPSTAQALVAAASLVVMIALLAHLRSLASWILDTYTGERLVLGFRAQLFRHLQRLSMAYHDRKGSTDSLYRVQYDAPAIQYIAIHGVIPFVTAAFTLTGMLFVMMRLDWQLSLIALGIAPVLFLVTGFYRKRLRNRWSELMQMQSSAMSVVQEVLSSVRVVKAFAQEDRESRRFESIASKSVREQLRVAVTQGGFDMAVGMTIAAGTGLALYIGVRHVQTGVLTLGELLMVMAYLAQLYSPLETISRKIADVQASLASAERAFVLLDEVPDVVERSHARALARASGAVRFEQVSFAYDAKRPVLRDVSFHVSHGTRVGLAGTTGAGKTTLLNLLTRFYDPVEGRILLDDVDLRDYRLADLRNQFAIVLQEPVLFSTTIAENIAYGQPGATEEQIMEAAKAANVHEFIMGLAEGYDTQVGERGGRLSGGERQRISLARAFLKDAPLLILDEPTSSVDVRTEGAIMDAMEHLMEGRTTFIIAHRLSTLRRCNLLLALENGRLHARAPNCCADGEALAYGLLLEQAAQA